MTSDVSNVSNVSNVSDGSGDVPLACSLSNAELRVRSEENADLFAHAREVEELPDGYRFAFPADEEGALALVRFILAERACCQFFTFELTFPSPHQAVWLAVRGSEEIKGIVRDALAPKARMQSLMPTGG